MYSHDIITHIESPGLFLVSDVIIRHFDRGVLDRPISPLSYRIDRAIMVKYYLGIYIFQKIIVGICPPKWYKCPSYRVSGLYTIESRACTARGRKTIGFLPSMFLTFPESFKAIHRVVLKLSLVNQIYGRKKTQTKP